MKLLLLMPQWPFPAHQGTTIRNSNLLRFLGARHEVTLAAFIEQGRPADLEAAAPFCAKSVALPAPRRSIALRAALALAIPEPDLAHRLASPEMHRVVAQLGAEDQFDWVQAEGIEMARYARDASLGTARFLLDEHNAEYALQRSIYQTDLKIPGRWPRALYSFVQWQKLRRYEAEACRRAAAVVTVSGTDARQLGEIVPGLAPIVIPNGVDLEYFQPRPEALPPARIVFTGKMDYRPNVDAAVWLTREILPRIWASAPEVRLQIVGQSPAAPVAELAGDRVEVSGAVPDVRPYVQAAAVYIAPLRMGSGTRLKLLEAMAMGKAIITTSVGAAGIDCKNERELLIRDDAAAIARAALGLLRDPKRRRELGARARGLVEAQYGWQTVLPRFEEVYAQPALTVQH